jgi:hypothetical protein
MLSLKQVDTILKSTFDNTRVQMLDSVYELSEDEKFYKLVFSIHSLDVELEDDMNTIIVHTKFIFRTNLEKTELIEDSFWYLKDINCVYVKVPFNEEDQLSEELERIINEDNFGEDLKNISHFISEAPSSSINDFLNQSGVRDFSVTNVTYDPKIKMTPCEDITFDFEIDLNNGENVINLSIKKDEEFKFYYYIEDTIEELSSSSVEQLPQIIGDHLMFIYEKYLK